MPVRIIKKTASVILPLLFWLIVWSVLAAIVKKEILLPSPYVVITRLASLAVTGNFWLSVLLSFARITTGFLIACITGVLLATATARFRLLNSLLSPLLTTVRATPVASFIILALVWLNRGTVPTFTSFLMVLPVIWGNVSTGISSADRELIEAACIFRLSRFKKLRLIYIPAVLPHFTSAFLTSIGLAWKAGVAAEVLCSPKLSVGGALYESKLYLETAGLFAWTLTLILISIVLEKTMTHIWKNVEIKFAGGKTADDKDNEAEKDLR